MSTMPQSALESATDIHARSLVWDAHCDTLVRVLVDKSDVGVKGDAQADLVRWQEGGIKVQVFAVWVDTIFAPWHAARRTLQQIDTMYQILDAYPDRIELARNAADIYRILAGNKLVALLAIEGGISIQNDLALLRSYHRLGATSMTLTHSATTDWADSSTDIPRWGGLNDFGREVIREMNRLRMVVDVSHVSDETARAVLKTSSAPIIASHSSCKAISNHPRNLSDDMLREIAAAGGVIGINFFAGFLCQEYLDRLAHEHGDLLTQLNVVKNFKPEELDERAAERQSTFYNFHVPRPPFERIIQHIDHAVQVAGIDHVGIGGDLDSGAVPMPEGLDTVSDYPKITHALHARGYAEEDIAKILGGNFMRVFEEVVG